MRPKKIILCVDANENDLSVLSFMLSTNGFRVLAARTAQEAIAFYSEHLVELALVDWALPAGGNKLVRQLKQIAHHVPMILLGDPVKMADQLHAADALLSKKKCQPQELLERIKIMSARKRGPRKGSVRKLPAVVAAPSAEERKLA